MQIQQLLKPNLKPFSIGDLHHLFNIQLNVRSYTGIIMIVGILAENAIFTVAYYRFNMQQTHQVDQSINPGRR